MVDKQNDPEFIKTEIKEEFDLYDRSESLENDLDFELKEETYCESKDHVPLCTGTSKPDTTTEKVGNSISNIKSTRKDTKCFKCLNCDYSTDQERYLLSHMLTHEKVKKFKSSKYEHSTNRKSRKEANTICEVKEKGDIDVRSESESCSSWSSSGDSSGSSYSDHFSNLSMQLHLDSDEPNYDESDDNLIETNDYGGDNQEAGCANLNRDPDMPTKKGVKRKHCLDKWKRNVQKQQRNSGKSYEMHNKEKIQKEERKMKAPCGAKCRLKCSERIHEDARKVIFSFYWNLGNITKQRQFISNSMQVIKPPYRYVREGGQRCPRNYNNAFYFHTYNEKIRVCKLFFKNTLDINDRPIRTVIDKRNKSVNTLVESDLRGKHGNHVKIDASIRDKIKAHIESIPKIESHYTRASTSKAFIDGSKTIRDIHDDYVTKCKEDNVPFGNYTLFYRIFTQEYNISFFTPKKDQCDICIKFENAEESAKLSLQEQYDHHLSEKHLSIFEKTTDKDTGVSAVAVYDLQAVMQLPKGDVSVFYYKSKLNVLNFTIYNLKSNSCNCYVWDESNGHCGVNELGTCVLDFIKEVLQSGKSHIIFYSDNCAGQQKNKFMLALYIYAVNYLGIDSITHKYLIKGHTQNEGNSAHSLIERQVKRLLRSGPIYVPETLVTAIRTAKKKGEPFNVKELCYEDFLNIKMLANEIGPLNMEDLKMPDIKVMKIVKESPTSVFCKYSYAENFQEKKIIKTSKIKSVITMLPCFKKKPGLPENKKSDLVDLCKKKLIPKRYQSFYEDL